MAQTLRTLDDITIPGDHPGEDRICITRSHESGDIAWRIDAPRSDPAGLMVWTLFYSMMTASGYRERIEKLERQIDELEKRMEGR